MIPHQSLQRPITNHRHSKFMMEGGFQGFQRSAWLRTQRHQLGDKGAVTGLFSRPHTESPHGDLQAPPYPLAVWFRADWRSKRQPGLTAKSTPASFSEGPDPLLMLLR